MRRPSLLFFNASALWAWSFSALSEDFLTVLIVGRTGAGKSTTANILLKDDAFKTGSGLESVTESVQSADVVYRGQKYRIFDTPGYLDVDKSSSEITVAIASWAHNSLHGIDAFLFLVPYGRLDSTHYESIRTYRNSFGDQAVNRTAIVITQLKPTSLSHEFAVGNMTACCAPGGVARQACCEIAELRRRGLPILSVAEPDNGERTVTERARIFDAISQIQQRVPEPYSSAVFESIQNNRTKLLQEINLLKFNVHRKEMHAMFNAFYAPDGRNDANSLGITNLDLWIRLDALKKDELATQEQETMSWFFRLGASWILSLGLECFVPTGVEALPWCEKSYRVLLLFLLYVVISLTDDRAYGMRYFLGLIPPILIFDVTTFLDMYLKLDDILPLLAAVIIHAVYIWFLRCVSFISILRDVVEAVYFGFLLGVIIFDVLRRDFFAPAPDSYPIERAAFVLMMCAAFFSLCEIYIDFVLWDYQPVATWRFRMAWRRKVVSRLEPVETDSHAAPPEGENDEPFPLRWREVKTSLPTRFDPEYREERIEQLETLRQIVILQHKERKDTHTVQALEKLPPMQIEPPTANTGCCERMLRVSMALLNGVGVTLLFLDQMAFGMAIAALDVVLLVHSAYYLFVYYYVAPDPQTDCVQYSKEWVVCEMRPVPSSASGNTRGTTRQGARGPNQRGARGGGRGGNRTQA